MALSSIVDIWIGSQYPSVVDFANINTVEIIFWKSFTKKFTPSIFEFKYVKHANVWKKNTAIQLSSYG